jgi:hypothetical protein
LEGKNNSGDRSFFYFFAQSLLSIVLSVAGGKEQVVPVFHPTMMKTAPSTHRLHKITINQESPMVTIDPDKSISTIPDGNSASTRSTVQQGEFDSVFREVADSTPIQGAEAEPTHFIDNLRPAQFNAEPSPSTNAVVDQVSRLIDTMEGYQQQLIDKDATLKDIQALVRRMESESQSLGAASKRVDGQDGLRTIIDQSLMLTSMEIVRFNSGHYNDD